MQVGHKMKKLRRRQFFDAQKFIEAAQRESAQTAVSIITNIATSSNL
jgi:hypothetical protein